MASRWAVVSRSRSCGMTPETAVTTGVLGLLGTGWWDSAGLFHPRRRCSVRCCGEAREIGGRGSHLRRRSHRIHGADRRDSLEGRRPATFFCVGQRVERHPGLATALHRAGHGLENHSFSHGTGRDLFQTERLAQIYNGARRWIAASPRRRRATTGQRWNPESRRPPRRTGRGTPDHHLTQARATAPLPSTHGGPGEWAPGDAGSIWPCMTARPPSAPHCAKDVRNLPELIRRLKDRGLRFLTLAELLTAA
jgi:hypothetical protein